MKDTKAWLIAYIILFIGIAMLFKLSEPRLKAHNKYSCAVYGMEEDCKTPLPEERRLK